MAWTIHSWSPADGVGTIASPHFGPVQFDSAANVDQVDDFRIGEHVVVELDGDAPAFGVRSVRPFSQRQPRDTHWPAFDRINGHFGDAKLEQHSDRALGFWLGDCCPYCTPKPTHLWFDDVSSIVGLDEITAFSDPLFRLASPTEVETNRLVLPRESRAFCIVTVHGHGPDGPSIFIVAGTARIVEPDDAP